jgi:hypothetical protein
MFAAGPGLLVADTDVSFFIERHGSLLPGVYTKADVRGYALARAYHLWALIVYWAGLLCFLARRQSLCL